MNRSRGNSPPQHMFSAISSPTKVSRACIVGALVLETEEVQNPELNLLEESKLKWEWQPTSQDPLAMTLHAKGKSYCGAMPRKTIKDLDIGLEAQKWKIEDGGSFGEKIRSLPDYMFLIEAPIALGMHCTVL
jgi:hypothetical protein